MLYCLRIILCRMAIGVACALAVGLATLLSGSNAPLVLAASATGSGSSDVGVLMRPADAPARVVVGVITEDNVNLRSGPGTSYEVITKLAGGTQLGVIGEEAGWYRVATAKGTVGWVVEEYFRIAGSGSSAGGSQQSQNVVANIIEDGVNLRTGPGTSYESLGRLGADVQVEVLGREGDWYNVRSPRGTIGWVSG